MAVTGMPAKHQTPYQPVPAFCHDTAATAKTGGGLRVGNWVHRFRVFYRRRSHMAVCDALYHSSTGIVVAGLSQPNHDNRVYR
ncbi:uncharacterized protein RSE6_11596 [Rhynchosporium secalis]|uniref:Uncharacterized protein n=1 Tax=Rhynchosporium secalis TaxID=38038 RepID=A0A1E1MNB7_RHYSE|nr:uncharacterized protein RSE6_11596 [Rhynchosporium secalis]